MKKTLSRITLLAVGLSMAAGSYFASLGAHLAPPLSVIELWMTIVCAIMLIGGIVITFAAVDGLNKSNGFNDSFCDGSHEGFIIGYNDAICWIPFDKELPPKDGSWFVVKNDENAIVALQFINKHLHGVHCMFKDMEFLLSNFTHWKPI